MSKPLPCLPHLPRHVKDIIVNNMDLPVRFTARRLNKEWRKLIDESPIHFKKAKLCLKGSSIEITLETYCEQNESLKVSFKTKNGGCIKTNLKNQVEQFWSDSCSIDLAVLNFATALKSRRCQVTTFSVKVPPRYIKDEDREDTLRTSLIKHLHLLDNEIHVETVKDHGDPSGLTLSSYLPFLQVGTLQKFKVCVEESDAWQEIFDMEHWKQAGQLYCFQKNKAFDFPWSHFEKVAICGLGVDFAKIEEQLLQNPTTPKQCRLRFACSDVSPFEFWSDKIENHPTNHKLKLLRFPSIPEIPFFLKIDESEIAIFREGFQVEERDEDELEEFYFYNMLNNVNYNDIRNEIGGFGDSESDDEDEEEIEDSDDNDEESIDEEVEEDEESEDDEDDTI